MALVKNIQLPENPCDYVKALLRDGQLLASLALFQTSYRLPVEASNFLGIRVQTNLHGLVFLLCRSNTDSKFYDAASRLLRAVSLLTAPDWVNSIDKDGKVAPSVMLLFQVAFAVRAAHYLRTFAVQKHYGVNLLLNLMPHFPDPQQVKLFEWALTHTNMPYDVRLRTACIQQFNIYDLCQISTESEGPIAKILSGVFFEYAEPITVEEEGARALMEMNSILASQKKAESDKKPKFYVTVTDSSLVANHGAIKKFTVKFAPMAPRKAFTSVSRIPALCQQ